MKIFLMILVPLSIPLIAWTPAKFWSLWGDPWCLKFYPDWLDRAIYHLASPYLSDEIGTASEQMEFLEVWIASVIIMEIAAFIAFYLFKDVFNEE